jgi:hypothetical protein
MWKKKIYRANAPSQANTYRITFPFEKMLGHQGIKPEELPPSEDIKKLERRVKSQERKLAAQAGKLPESTKDRKNDDEK